MGAVISAPVVGNYYASARAQQAYSHILRHPNADRLLWLVFEPGNKYDVNAVAVYDNTTMLGHIDRSSAARVTALVHLTLDDAGVDRLDKTKYRILATPKVVGDRVYATIVGCERIITKEK